MIDVTFIKINSWLAQILNGHDLKMLEKEPKASSPGFTHF